MRKIYLVAGLVAVLLAAAGGFWLWERKQLAREQEAVLQLMAGASAALRTEVAAGGDAIARSSVWSAAAQRVDTDAAALRALEAERVPELSEAVTSYLDTARELLKRRAHIAELEPRVRQGLVAFRQHMLHRGGADWTGEAVRIKNRLEEDFRDYQRTIETHTRLSDGYAEEYERLAPLVPADELVPLDAVNAVRDRIAVLGQSANAEMEALRRLTAPAS